MQLFLDDGVPDIPPAAVDVWNISHGMEIGRTGYGYGFVRFSWIDISAFCREIGHRLKPWQMQALREMETVWLNHKNASSITGPDKPKQRIGVAFSEELFDAWFGD